MEAEKENKFENPLIGLKHQRICKHLPKSTGNAFILLRTIS